MQLRFNIGDSLYEQFVLKFGVQGTYQRMRKILEEMVSVDPNDRYIIITGDPRRAIEKVFETTLDTPEKLVKLIQRLNEVSVEGVAMTFTTEELARIDQQAVFQGKTREAFLLNMLSDVKNYMLDQV